jgi:hypothetical protein
MFGPSPKWMGSVCRNRPHPVRGWAEYAALRVSEGSGRPVGNAEFIAGLDRLLGPPIARRAPERKPQIGPDEGQLNLGL